MPGQFDWPPDKVGTGPAMRREQVAERCGVGVSTVDNARRRTKQGTARVAFPQPDGYAIPPGGDRPVAYWFERVVVKYGIAAGWLDGKTGRPIVKPTPAATQ
jgi:hypothetical protein